MQSASLYNHFPSKDAMLTELVLLGLGAHLDSLIAAIVNAPVDPRDQLRAAIYRHVLIHCEFPNLGLVGTHEQRHLAPEVKPQAEAIRQRSAMLVSQVLDRGCEQGVFSIEGPRVALFAMASMGVDAARWYPHQTEISAEQLSDSYAALALRMVGASTDVPSARSVT
jgi:AcrR family transcriptional regulator